MTLIELFMEYTSIFITLIVLFCIIGLAGISVIVYTIVKLVNLANRNKKNVSADITPQIHQTNQNLVLTNLTYQDCIDIVNNIIILRVKTLVRVQELGNQDEDMISVMLNELQLQLCTDVDMSINTPLRCRLLSFVTDDYLKYYIMNTIQSVLVMSIYDAREKHKTIVADAKQRQAAFIRNRKSIQVSNKDLRRTVPLRTSTREPTT